MLEMSDRRCESIAGFVLTVWTGTGAMQWAEAHCLDRNYEGRWKMPLEERSLKWTQLGLGLDDEVPQEEEKGQGEEFRAGLFRLIAGAMQNAEATAETSVVGWMDGFQRLIQDGWPWRKAAYIAWKATPKERRWPKTQAAFATDILGLASDRVIHQWREKNPALEQTVTLLQTAEFLQHRGAVMEALVQSASTPDYKHHPDRKLFLEMTGDYLPVSQLRALLLSGKFKTQKGLEDLSDEELDRLIGGDLSVLRGGEDEGQNSGEGLDD
jgi:hypothetical protein